MKKLSRPTSRRGFVLLMTLLLLPVVAVSVAGVCLASMNAALDAGHARRDLQRRWGMISCRRALWPLAGRMIDHANENADQPVIQVALDLTLADQTFHLVFADEQAKLNLNAIYRRRGPEVTRECLREMTGSGSDLLARIDPQPHEEASSQDTGQSGGDGGTANTTVVVGKGSFGSFGQVYSNPTGEELLQPATDAGGDHLPDGAATRLTLWGTGHVNMRRASQQTLQWACAPVLGLGDIDRLLELRAKQPGIDLYSALSAMELTKEQRSQLINILSDQSNCQSMWITCDDSRRCWRELHVAVLGATEQAISFRW